MIMSYLQRLIRVWEAGTVIELSGLLFPLSFWLEFADGLERLAEIDSLV